METDFNSDMIERLLLKKAIVDKKWLNIVSKVYDRRWFKVKNLGLTLQLIVKWFDKYGDVPNNQYIMSMVKKYAENHPEEEIKASDTAELLSSLSTVDCSSNEEAVNSNLKEFIRRNAFYNALFDNSTILSKDPNAYEKVVDKCLENFDRVQKITFSDTDLGMNYFDPVAMEKHWEYINNPEAKIKTGWNALDSYTNGGFLKDGRSLYLVMAQAGLGKSVFLSNLAVNFMKQNLSVVVISLEMSEDVYATRFDSHISNKDINHLKENEDEAKANIKAFYAKHSSANLIIKEWPPKSITCNDIQAYLENLQNNGYHFDVVIVDYLNLVKSAMKTDNMFMDGLDVSEKLRALSYKFKCPIISAIQTNTEGMNNENVGMENISQSRGVAFTADFLMALFQTADNRENGIISARLLKNRLGGMVGKVMNYKIDPLTLNLADITFDPNVDDSHEMSADDAMHGIMNDLNSI